MPSLQPLCAPPHNPHHLQFSITWRSQWFVSQIQVKKEGKKNTFPLLARRRAWPFKTQTGSRCDVTAPAAFVSAHFRV